MNCTGATMKASIVIPTKNPGSIFRRVLEKALTQQAPWPFEIIVVDSGSTDGTAEYAQSKPGVRVIPIPPETFGHGRSRNLAIGHARGEFVALLTHDALPMHDLWLANIVTAVEQHPSIAGAFGRHVAYEHSSPFTKRDLENHFAGFLAHPRIVNRYTDPEKYDRDLGWQQFLHFYSDNNSCLRRAVWERVPYPDVEFAEDQIWAQLVIKAGWSKAYAHDAVVYHSHEYTVIDSLRRAYDESAAFRRLFGYRLGGSPRNMAKSIIGLATRDRAWARENEVPPKNTRKRVMQDVALVIGHGLGSRVDSLPKWVQSRLSRDKRMFRSLPVST
jgi:rhamnosyltransferase